MTKSIREFPLEVQAIQKSNEAFLDKNPTSSSYYFLTLSEKGERGSIDGGGISNPIHAAMLAQGLATTLIELGEQWKDPRTHALGKIILDATAFIFSSGIKEHSSIDVGTGKGKDH